MVDAAAAAAAALAATGCCARLLISNQQHLKCRLRLPHKRPDPPTIQPRLYSVERCFDVPGGQRGIKGLPPRSQFPGSCC
jgi:hypothetical protein